MEKQMLISRAPVRISFGGGGTDLPSFYERYGGMVISTTINHHVYAIITPGGRDVVQIVSADYHTFWRQSLGNLIWDGDLALPRAIVHEFGLLLSALVVGGFGIKPAVETDVQECAAFRTSLLPSDFAGWLERVSAGLAIHGSILLMVLSGIIPF